MLPFCTFSASFSHKFDVTDTIWQDDEKMKVQYLRSLLFDWFKILQAVRTNSKGLPFDFKFHCYGNQKSKQLSVLKKKVYCSSRSIFQKII